MSACHQCGYEIDAYTCVTEEGADPVEHDLSICIKCGGLAIFTGQGIDTREPTEEEHRMFGNSPDVVKAQAAIIMARNL